MKTLHATSFKHPQRANNQHVSLLAAGLLLVVIFSSCGREGPPLPPLSKLPAPPASVTATQVGDDAEVEVAFERITESGLPLADFEGIELLRIDLPTAMLPQNPARRRKLVESKGNVVGSLTADELRGDLARFTIKLGEPEKGKLACFAARLIAGKGRSELSDVACLEPKRPPTPPSSFSAQPKPDGIELVWEPKSEAVVERSSDCGPAWIRVTENAVKPPYLDKGASQGKTWCYRVRVLEDGVLGYASDAVRVDYVDKYPPQEPTGLVCLPEPPVVRLKWDPVRDAAFYRVIRVDKEGKQTVLAEKLRGTSFRDEKAPSGEVEYRVAAVDASGNVSEETPCRVEVVASP